MSYEFVCGVWNEQSGGYLRHFIYRRAATQTAIQIITHHRRLHMTRFVVHEPCTNHSRARKRYERSDAPVSVGSEPLSWSGTVEID